MHRLRPLLLILVMVSLLSCGDGTEKPSPPMQLVFWYGLGAAVVDWTGPWQVTPPRPFLELKIGYPNPGGLDVIDAVSAGENGVLGFIGWNDEFKSSFAFLRYPTDGHVERIAGAAADDHSYTMAMMPGNRGFVFLSISEGSPRGNVGDMSKERMDIAVYDLAKRQGLRFARGEASVATQVSLTPDGRTVTFDAADGWIKSVNLSTGEVTKLLEGHAPAWSPDGTRLAYRQDRSLFVYEVATKISRRLYIRYPWQRDFITHLRGTLRWSPDGRYLAVNVWSYSLFPLRPELEECVVIEVRTGRSSSVGDSARCGPWVQKVS